MEKKVAEFNEKMDDAINNPKFMDVNGMAQIIFGGSKELAHNEIIMMQLSDPDSDPELLFQMLLDLILHGINVISGGATNLFELSIDNEMIKGIVSNINSYLEKFNIRLCTYIMDLPIGAASVYREWEDYYCEIMRKNPHSRNSDNQWVVLDNYLIHENEKFVHNKKTTPLNHYRFVIRPKGTNKLLYFYFESGFFQAVPLVPPEKTTMLL